MRGRIRNGKLYWVRQATLCTRLARKGDARFWRRLARHYRGKVRTAK